MVVMREFINGCNRYTLDGEKVTRCAESSLR